MEPQNSSGSFASFFGDLIKNFASGYGQGLGSKAVNSGRQPGTEQFYNPFIIPSGTVGQPGTYPAGSVVSGNLLANALPYVLIAGGVLAAALLYKSVR